MSLQIRFHPDLYLPEAVHASAEAFAGLATFTVEKHEGAMNVSISDIREEARDAIEDEFCNHVLAGTIRSRRAGSAAEG